MKDNVEVRYYSDSMFKGGTHFFLAFKNNFANYEHNFFQVQRDSALFYMREITFSN